MEEKPAESIRLLAAAQLAVETCVCRGEHTPHTTVSVCSSSTTMARCNLSNLTFHSSNPVFVELRYTLVSSTTMEAGWTSPGSDESNSFPSLTRMVFSQQGIQTLVPTHHADITLARIRSLRLSSGNGGNCPHWCVSFTGKTAAQIPSKLSRFLVGNIPTLVISTRMDSTWSLRFSFYVLVKSITCDTTVALFCPFKTPVRHCPRWGLVGTGWNWLRFHYSLSVNNYQM